MVVDGTDPTGVGLSWTVSLDAGFTYEEIDQSRSGLSGPWITVQIGDVATNNSSGMSRIAPG